MMKQQLSRRGNSGNRKPGIPTVLDRFIQQALQVLQPIFDPIFSEDSCGFRLGAVRTTLS